MYDADMARIASSSNPYRPSWGTPPPVLAGRDEELARAMEALTVGAHHPLFSHVNYGDRGTGKTVLLDAIAARCQQREWPVINVACRAGTGIVEGLVQLHLPETLRVLTRRRGRKPNTEVRGSVGVPGVAQVSAGASWSEAQRGLGVEFERLLAAVGEAAQRRDARVVVGIDEMHAIDPKFDLPTLAGVLQLVAQRRGLPVAMIGAGLPELVDTLSGPSVTFLERLRKFELGYLSADASRYALVAPAQAQGAVFDLEAADLLTSASAGFPYYVQLLGWETWAAAARTNAHRITIEHAWLGIRSAEVVVVEQVLEPRFRRLAPKEQGYLRAMAVDGDIPSTTADLVRRLGADRASDISYLRERLLRQHMIRAVSRGRVAFTLPGMSAWLRGEEPTGLPPGPKPRR